MFNSVPGLTAHISTLINSGRDDFLTLFHYDTELIKSVGLIIYILLYTGTGILAASSRDMDCQEQRPA